VVLKSTLKSRYHQQIITYIHFIMVNVFKLVRILHSVYEPAFKSSLNPVQAAVLEVDIHIINAELGIASTAPQHFKMSANDASKYDPLPKTGEQHVTYLKQWFLNTRQICYEILGYETNLVDQFWGEKSLFEGLTQQIFVCFDCMELRHLILFLKHFLQPMYVNCPPDLYPSIGGPFKRNIA